MPKQLLLMRHAKSSWDSDAPTDFLRPLAKRGRKAAPRIGAWLQARELVPEMIISSPATRARQTTLAVANVLAMDDTQLQWEEQIYDASRNDLLAVVKACPKKLERIMLVGHNPGFEELLQWLCADRIPATADGKLLPTAAVAVLALATPWRDVNRGSATLLDLQRARDLKQS